LTEQYSAKTVVTSDARYANPEDEEAVDTLFCIHRNQQVSDPNRFKMVEKDWFKNWEEMAKILDFVPEKLLEKSRENSLKIAERIDLKLEFGLDLLPHCEVDQNKTEASQLRENCVKNVEKFYGEDFQKDPKFRGIIEERLNYELSIIGKMGFDAYFLIVQDFINFAKNNNIAVGPGRGSAAGSIVSYLLGITSIDPIKYELLFERFLNPERISMPDIDIDFSDERREEVFQYVIEKYGMDKVSKVCTFGTLSAKAALKDVGRAQGVPYSEMNLFTKLLPNRPGFKLDEALDVPDFKTLVGSKPHLKKVFDVAKKLEGCVRHVSVHACAVIIGKDDLSKYTPLQWAPGAEEIKITQFPYQKLENIGLLKMDFLGLKNLSILEKAIGLIKITTGEELDLQKIPIDDKKTFEMFARGETTGVFQFESAGMRRYLKELQPTEFEDLVAMNALYRPGPMEYIPDYIKGKHNPKKVKYVDKALQPLLEKTYGIAVYQEQILKIAQIFAGFSLGQADILRKAIGKKKVKLLAEQRLKFIDGAINNGFTKKLAVKIFDDIIVPFSGYGFNRSHAVCYSRIAYETAYLRANYPVEFMAAMMTTDRNNTDRIVLEMSECNTMGIDVLPPSINESFSYFTVVNFEIQKQEKLLTETENPAKIRFGLSAIKGLGEETVDQIIAERKSRGKFESLQDFAKRVNPRLINKKTLEALAFSGGFDEFGNRRAVVDSLDDLTIYAKEYHEKKEAGQMGLFGGVDETAVDFTLKNTVATKKDILNWERESLGMFVSDHPLKGLSKYFEKFGQLIGKITEENVGKKCTLHGMVTEVRRITTKSGKQMAIITIEDTSGKIELPIFPQKFAKIPAKALEKDAFIRIKGKVEERDGIFNMIPDDIKIGDLEKIQRIHRFEEEGQDSAKSITNPQDEIFIIEIPAKTLKSQIMDLKSLLKANESTDEKSQKVELIFNHQKKEVPFKVLMTKDLKENLKRVFL
jgi:DNA polymerase-3 subunit alpha